MITAIIARGIGHERAATHGCDLAIGINHAAGMYPCDWWCFCDMEVPMIITPIGSPRWFTNERTLRRLRNEGVQSPANVMPWEIVASPGVAWRTQFSSVWALILAKQAGATLIKCFGLYTMNFPDPVEGELPRWVAERVVWNQVVDWLGMKVIRA